MARWGALYLSIFCPWFFFWTSLEFQEIFSWVNFGGGGGRTVSWKLQVSFPLKILLFYDVLPCILPSYLCSLCLIISCTTFSSILATVLHSWLLKNYSVITAKYTCFFRYWVVIPLSNWGFGGQIIYSITVVFLFECFPNRSPLEFYTHSGFSWVPLSDRISCEHPELCLLICSAACCCSTMMLLKYLNPPVDINHLIGFPVPMICGFPVCNCCPSSLSC